MMRYKTEKTIHHYVYCLFIFFVFNCLLIIWQEKKIWRENKIITIVFVC